MKVQRRGIQFLSVIISLALSLCLSDLVLVRQLPVSTGLEPVLSLSCSLLVIVQKQQTKGERGKKTERETLSVQSFEKTNNSRQCIWLVPNGFGVGLLMENAKRQMGPCKNECEVCVFTDRLLRVLAMRANTPCLLLIAT